MLQVRRYQTRHAPAFVRLILFVSCVTSFNDSISSQVRLRAACLGVKIRAEDGLGNTVKNIHHCLKANTAKATADKTNRAAASMGVIVDRIGEAGTELVLREMSNGIPLWISSDGEQEAFFIYNEVFEDKTYSRMGIGVRDGDILWDVGESTVYLYFCNHMFHFAVLSHRAMERNILVVFHQRCSSPTLQQNTDFSISALPSRHQAPTSG